MRLSGIKAVAARQRGSFTAEAVPAQPAEPSRAIVALAPPSTVHEAPSRYLQATFLTQLLATKDDHPQTRERRRAEPAEALAAYRATAALYR